MKNSRNWIINLLPYLIVLFAISSIFMMSENNGVKTLGYNELLETVETKTLSNVRVTAFNTVIDIDGTYTDGDQTIRFTSNILNSNQQADQLMELLASKGVTDVVVVDPYQSNAVLDLIMQFVPFLLFGAFAFFMFSRMNGGGNSKAFEFGKSRARLEGDIRVRFKDVAGCDEEKEEMAELIEYLKNPKKFSKMGARIPKGILLVGPPGTGKTLLAKAVAGEADVPFYSISGSDFVEMFVGVGASRVRDMFKKAQATAPSMIFIDEIDAVGRQRGAGLGGGHDEREQTLNQMLVEMDGMTDNGGVVVIAATNRGDVLDPALLRPGRFDRQITVNLPDRKGRKEILEVHARNKHLAPDVELENIAKRTPGFSGADLENVLNESAILAVRQNKDVINMDDIDEAIDRVIGGPAKKSKKYNEDEKRLVAYHETGHTIIGLLLEDAMVVQKVTIIPRGQAGGYNLMTPKDDKFLHTKTDLISKITSYLGGRVAEEIVFNEISTGASNDIQEATKIARAMVTTYGMSNLGTIQYSQGGNNVFLGRDYTQNATYSSQIAFEIDKAVREIIDQCYANAKRIITDNRELLDLIANTLVEKETLTQEEIMSLYKEGKLPENGNGKEQTSEVIEVANNVVEEPKVSEFKPENLDEESREQ